ncbi:hypothetical protein MTO96_001746 [Rhipicephalus appendiculatus]
MKRKAPPDLCRRGSAGGYIQTSCEKKRCFVLRIFPAQMEQPLHVRTKAGLENLVALCYKENHLSQLNLSLQEMAVSVPGY